MGVLPAIRGSGALWLVSMALGAAREALDCPVDTHQYHISTISVSQRFPRLLGYCLQCAGLLSVWYRYLSISRYLGI